jgi:hypothetical protein
LRLNGLNDLQALALFICDLKIFPKTICQWLLAQSRNFHSRSPQIPKELDLLHFIHEAGHVNLYAPKAFIMNDAKHFACLALSISNFWYAAGATLKSASFPHFERFFLRL